MQPEFKEAFVRNRRSARRTVLAGLAVVIMAGLVGVGQGTGDSLKRGFENPPESAGRASGGTG